MHPEVSIGPEIGKVLQHEVFGHPRYRIFDVSIGPTDKKTRQPVRSIVAVFFDYEFQLDSGGKDTTTPHAY
jgi:hypothetical protein